MEREGSSRPSCHSWRLRSRKTCDRTKNRTSLILGQRALPVITVFFSFPDRLNENDLPIHFCSLSISRVPSPGTVGWRFPAPGAFSLDQNLNASFAISLACSMSLSYSLRVLTQDRGWPALGFCRYSSVHSRGSGVSFVFGQAKYSWKQVSGWQIRGRFDETSILNRDHPRITAATAPPP